MIGKYQYPLPGSRLCTGMCPRLALNTSPPCSTKACRQIWYQTKQLPLIFAGIIVKPVFFAGCWSDSCNNDCGHTTGNPDCFCILQVISIPIFRLLWLWLDLQWPARPEGFMWVSHLKTEALFTLDFRWEIFPLGSVNRRWLTSSTSRCISVGWHRSLLSLDWLQIISIGFTILWGA